MANAHFTFACFFVAVISGLLYLMFETISIGEKQNREPIVEGTDYEPEQQMLPLGKRVRFKRQKDDISIKKVTKATTPRGHDTTTAVSVLHGLDKEATQKIIKLSFPEVSKVFDTMRRKFPTDGLSSSTSTESSTDIPNQTPTSVYIESETEKALRGLKYVCILAALYLFGIIYLLKPWYRERIPRRRRPLRLVDAPVTYYAEGDNVIIGGDAEDSDSSNSSYFFGQN